NRVIDKRPGGVKQFAKRGLCAALAGCGIARRGCATGTGELSNEAKGCSYARAATRGTGHIVETVRDDAYETWKFDVRQNPDSGTAVGPSDLNCSRACTLGSRWTN